MSISGSYAKQYLPATTRLKKRECQLLECMYIINALSATGIAPPPHRYVVEVAACYRCLCRLANMYLFDVRVWLLLFLKGLTSQLLVGAELLMIYY